MAKIERYSTLSGSRNGIRPAHAQTQYIHQVFKLVSMFDRRRVGGWVGGWVVNEGRFLDEKKSKQGLKGGDRREKQDGAGRGKARQRDVFLKTKIWLCQCL